MTELLTNLRKELLDDMQDLKSEVQLQQQIERVSGGKLARSKLRQILGTARRNGSEVSLTFSHIEVLDAYLLARGKGGLASLLPTLLGSVAARGKVVFLVPSKEFSGSTATVKWDTLALAAVTKALTSISRSVATETVLVELPPVAKIKEAGTREPSIDANPWLTFLSGKNAPSVICFGTPRANLATEHLLAKMYGVQPFSPSVRPKALPFGFFWRGETRPGCFTLNERDLPHQDELANFRQTKKLSTLVVRDEVGIENCFHMQYDEKTPHWNTYGIIAAQRRESGQVWVVAAGLEGPGTLAAAKHLISLRRTVAATSQIGVSQTLQGYFSHEVLRKPQGTSGDMREIGNELGELVTY